MLKTLSVIFTLLQLVSTLQHEKSFMFDPSVSTIYAVAVYNSSLLFTSTNDVVQKDIETGNVQRRFIAHSGQIRSFIVVNGSRMITSAWDDMIIVWDLRTGSVLRRIPLEASNTYPKSIQFVKNNLYVFGQDSRLRIVNMLSGRAVQTIAVSEEANAVVVGEDSFYVGKRGFFSQLEKYSLSTRLLQVRYVGHQNAVMSLCVWEGMLFSGSFTTEIIGWNELDGQILHYYDGHSAPVGLLSVFDGVLYSAGQENIIISWNIDSGTIRKSFPRHHVNIIWCFAYEKGALFSGSTDSVAIRWDVNSGSRVFAYLGRNIRLRSVVLWKGFVISGGENPMFSVYDKAQNFISPVEIMSGHSYWIVCMAVLGDTLFSGSVDASIRRTSLLDYKELQVYNGHQATINTVTLDEKFLYSGSSDFTVKRWNISTGVVDTEYEEPAGYLMAIQVRNDYLYACSYGTFVRFWNKEQGINSGFFDYPTEVITILVLEDVIIAGSTGIGLISISSGEILARQEETSPCQTIVAAPLRIYSGHIDGVIRGRDMVTLNILNVFQGHQDAIMSLCLDESGVLFSTGYDGSVKKWNMATRKTSFSYENRNGSVTALSAFGTSLLVGTREGLINAFNINDGYIINSTAIHTSAVTSLSQHNDMVYSSGLDGAIFGFFAGNLSNMIKMYDSGPDTITTMALITDYVIAVKNDNEIVLLSKNNSNLMIRSINSPLPLLSIASSEEVIFAGSKSGSIRCLDIKSMEFLLSLDGHTSQVNHLLLTNEFLYSASNDKSVIKWSVRQKIPILVFQRLSASALGHLGPVNSLSVCGDTLFSAGSDLTTRRWNSQTAKHEDVYFGPTKSVTSVICYNGSVFSGSEDFSVLMYSPALSLNVRTQTTASASIRRHRKTRTRIAFKLANQTFERSQSVLMIIGLAAALLLLGVLMIAFFRRSSNAEMKQAASILGSSDGTSEITTNLETVVNTVIGISKHAAFLVSNSNLATIKKLASGGGGEIFLARVMNPFLNEKAGNIVIQKVVFIKSIKSEEAFYQEVGIMIMLSTFPNFCRIIGYTVSPASMILQYYPGGSLQNWIKGNHFGRKVLLKFSKEISSALKIMHSSYLAHCDIKSQNVLIEISDGLPSCYLTDFGVSQVLSDMILASREFNVINLKGLSVHYAAPEAFQWFRTKKSDGVEFKKFDVYSFACILMELLSRKTPWN